jgi:hypothetical protein
MIKATAQQNTGVCCQGRFGLGGSATARANTESASRSIRQRRHCYSTFHIWVRLLFGMPRHFPIPLALLFSFAFLNGCASTTTTTVGVTTNDAPKVHELGR